MPHCLIDIIRKTVKSSNLETLQIIQNINKLMFQIIFIYSAWIFIKQIIACSTPFVLGKTVSQKNLPGVLSRGLGHKHKCKDSMHFLGMWIP